MSMYKNIFVNEEYDGTAEGAKVLGVNGEVLIFGQSAFASLDEATKDADIANSVIRVTTGAYDEFYVADANGNVSVADQVVVVEFNGGDDLTYDNGEYSRTVTMEAATYTKEERAQIIDALNDNNAASGTVYTTDAKGGNYSTIYVGSTSDFADIGDIKGISETVDYGNQIKNDEAFVIVDKNTSISDVISSIEHEAGHLKGESHPVTDGTIKDFLQEETDIRYLNGTTVTEAVDTEHRVMVGSLAKDSTTDVVGTMEKSEVTISADVNTAALWVGARYEDDIVDGKTATLNVTGAGTVVTAGDSELVENDKKIKNEGFIVRSSGIVNVTDGAEINVKWDAQTIIQGAVNVDGEGSKLTYEGSNPLKIYKDNAILTIKNGGELDFEGYEFQVGQSDGRQGKLVIESGATASIDADTAHTGFINHQNGLISVDGATLITNKLTNNGTVNVSGNSTLDIAALTGNALNVVGTTTLTDSVVMGNVYAGFSNHHAADLTINGSFTASALYVGDKWEHYTDGTTHTLAINTGADKEMNVGSLYVRPTTTATITDSTVKTKDLFVRGVMNVSGSTLDANSSVAGGTGHWAVYEDDATDKTAALIVNNSKLLNSSASKAINYLIIGSNSNSESAADSNAYASFTNSSVAVNTLYVQGSDTFANNYVELNNSTLTANKVFLHEDAIINVSGTSDLNVANKVTGSGMIYMDGVTLGSDTKLDGANVRFASGINTIDGATIDNGKFQIGQGQYGNTDNRIDMENGVTVNVQNNAHIGSLDAAYHGWIGTGFFNSDAEKLEAMTDAKYTLNIDKSTAEFGYLHISNDGVMNVTGVADQKLTYNGSDYSFRAGDFIINGEAKFDGADVLAAFTKVSCDNGTANGGHLIITNGSYYEAETHDGSDDNANNLVVYKTGVVDVNGGSTLYVGGKASIAENAAVNVNGANVNITGTVTNKGTFTIAGESTVNIAAVAAGSNDIELSEGTILKDSTIMGDVGVTGNVIFRGKNVLNNLYDFGEYGAYGNTDWAKWTVEAGSQLFLEQTVTGLGNNLYGVGYGDTVVINGELTDAAAAREAGLTKDNASFYSRTGVRFSSGAGWATSHFTVNNAYVILGTDGSFSNSASNGGSHEITFNNALVDAAQFYFSESTATFKITINDSDIETAIFMTADKDSVYTLSGSKVVTTGSGNDRYNGNDGALTLTDSEIEVKSGSYKNNGTIVMDAKSKLTAATLTGTGTITIDASEVTGDFVKVIDLNGTASIEDKVTVSGLKEGYSVVYGSDGDVILTSASANTLYVNSAYTQPAGTQLDDGKIIGFNAFSNMTDAIKAAEKNGGATIDLGTEKYSGNMNGPANAGLFQTNGTYTFTGGDYVDFAYVDTPRPTAENAGKVDVNIVFDNAKVTAGKFRLDNGATLTIKDSYVDAQAASGASVGWTTYYGDSKIYIDNSVVGWYTNKQAIESSTITAGDKTTNYYGTEPYGTAIGYMTLQGSGVMEVVGSTIFTYVDEGATRDSLSVYDKGLMSFTDSAIYAYAITVGTVGTATVGRDDEVATMIFDNSTLRLSLNEGANEINVGDGGATAGKLIVRNGSVIDRGDTTMNVRNNGTVEIDDSEVKVGSITNAGVITIDAVSTIKANTITGTGTITIDASEVTGDYVKVIDLNGTASIEDKVTVSGLKEGYSVVYGSDGDVILTTASTNTLYVNSAYTGAVGSQVAGEPGKIIGYNAFNNMQDVVDKFSSYATENQQDLIINIDGESATSNSGKIFFYTGADVTLTGTAGSVLDATSGSRLYFIDTIVPNGSEPSSYDTSDVATVTIAEGLTVKSKRFHLGQTVDTGENGDVDENGKLTRDAGAIHMIINGNVNCSNYTIASGSSMTINETGTFVAREGGDDHLRADSSLVVNGGGKYSADNLQFQSNWVANRGGDMTFNDTFIKVGTVKLLPDESNAAVSGDTVATFNLNNSTAEVHAFEISADSSLNVKNSNLTVGTITGAGKVIGNGNVTLNVDNISAQVLIGGTYENGSRVYNENRSTLNLGSATAGKAMNIKQEEFRVNNADITLNSDVNVALGGGHSLNFLYLRQSTLDLNGHTLDMSKGKFLLTGLDITGQGTINLSGGNDAFCVQTYASTIGKDVTFISEVPANIYEDLTVYGDMTVNGHSGQGPAIVGVHAVDRKDGKITNTYTDGAVLKISGEGATYTQTGNTNMHIYGAASDDLNAEIAADLGEEYRIGASSFVIENKAVADLTQAGTLTNDGSLIVSDATLKAGNIVNNANFYANAGSTVTVTGNFTSTTDLTFNGNVTIGGTLTVDNLTLSAGSNVTVGNLVVNKELNFVLGAALTITDATLGNFNLTVNGTLSASEYELVSGWKVEYDKTITFNGVTYTLDEATGIYRNENDTNITFKINTNGVLVLNDKAAQAAAGSVLIDPSLTAGSGASVVIDGIRYTEGVNAFKSVDKIPADKLITGVVLTNADVDAKLNSTALDDVQTVTVQGTGNTIDGTVTGDTGYTLNVGAGSMLTGTGLFDVNGDMMINNDGHLDTNATASGAMKIVNTSANTLKGTYTATDLIIDNQVSGAIEGATLNGTVSTAISGGTGTDVTVNTPHLSLTDTKFEIEDGSILSTHTDGESGAESETGIHLKGDTDLTISKAGEISATIREAADNVGNTTLTTVGTQTYTGDIEVDKIIIGNEVKTTITGTADFSDLDLNGELTVDMTAGTEYTEAGRVNGEGTLNLTHENAWIVNDTVNRDFSGFTGTVNMTGADTKQIVLGLGDAPVATPASSYFANGTTVNVAAGQEIYLAGTGVDTAIKFAKDGAINVGKLDPSLTIQDGITAELAESSVGFTQTLSGDNSGFTGTVNVSEDTELTIANKLGATAINMDVKESATGDTDDTKLNLNYDGLELAAKIAGDNNDQINVQKSATLTADEALDAFSGTVNMTQATEEATSLTLNGENTTAAKFVGADVDTINANADTTLTAAGAIDGFSGTVDVADDKAVTLTGENTTDAKFVGGETAGLNLDANTVLNAAGAINGFSGTVDMKQATEAATSLTLNGENTTAAKFVGADVDTINANANITLEADTALNGFDGKVVMADNVVVTLNGENTTGVILDGDTTNTLDVNADTELTADGAITNFSGTVDMTQATEEATTLTISGANTTAATFKGADVDAINVNADNTFSADNSVFKGTLTLDEGTTLTLQGNMGAKEIYLGIEEPTVSTTLNVDSVSNAIVIDGAIYGDADDVINAYGGNEITFKGDNSNFGGTINIDDNQVNFTSSAPGTVTVKFGAEGSKINFQSAQKLFLNGKTVEIGSTFVSEYTDSVIQVSAGNTTTTLLAEGALDGYKGQINLVQSNYNGHPKLILSGNNSTQAVFVNNPVPFTATITDAEITLGGDLTLKTADAMAGLWGRTLVNINDNTLTLNANQTFGKANSSQINGAIEFTSSDNTATINVAKDVAVTMANNKALDAFSGTVTLAENADLTLKGTNITAAKFNGDATSTLKLNNAGATVLKSELTLTTAEALNAFHGTLDMQKAVLTLNATNTTDMTLKGYSSAKIVVNADNTFSGDVSGFAGLYDIATDAELTLSGTFSNTIRAKGDTLTLSGNAKNDATTTVTAENALANLNIDDNNVTLAKGDFTNISGEAGSELHFSEESGKAFNDVLGNVSVGTVYTTDTLDITVAGAFTADVDMTINTTGATNAASDLTLSGDEAGIAIGAIELHNGTNIAISAAGEQHYYYLITGSGDAVSSDVQSIMIDGEEVKVGQSLLHSDGNRYFLNIIEDTGVEHLVLVSKVGYSNYVTVNGAWTGKPDGAEVTDAAGTVRNINYDAAASMDAAIDSIRGNNNWNKTTEEGGEAKGAAQIELDVNGEYAITEGKYLMDAANGVTDLTINGRTGANAVVITSDIYGSDGNRLYKDTDADTGLDTVTSLTLKNVTTYGNIYGGGKLTIDNSSNASAWTSGSVVVAGINGGTTNHDTELVLNGGYFTSTYLSGGSWALADNVTAKDSKIVINGGVTAIGTIIGGGYATNGKTLTQGDATVEINATGKISLGGSIYAGGGIATGGKLTVGNRTVILSGDAANLAFTGTVYGSAYGKTKTDITYNGSATIAFKDWTGTFNGSLADFDTLLISGDTSLEFARRQNKTAETGITFDVGGRTNTTDAMYTVRDANRWEFSKTITISVVDDLQERAALSNGVTYTLVSNLNGGFTGFTFMVGDETLALGGSVTLANGDTYSIAVDGTSLKLTVDAADITIPGTGTDVNGSSIYVEDNSTTAALNIVGTGAASAAEAKDVNIYVGKQTSNVAKIAGVNSGYAGDVVINANTAATFLHGVGNGATAESVTINVGMANMDYNHIKAADTNGAITGDAAINVLDGADLSSGNQDILIGGIYSTSTTTIGGNTSITIGSVGGSGVKIGSAGNFSNIVGAGGGTTAGDSTITVNAGEIFARSLIGGASWGGTVTDSSVEINGGKITLASDEAKRAIYGGSYGAGMTTGSGLVTINGGQISGNIVGGSQTTEIASATIDINGGTINSGTIFAAGLEDTGKVSGDALVDISGGTIADGVVIDGQDGRVAGTSQLNITGGNVNADVKDFDAIAMDVDAVLNGAMTGVDKLTLSGITGLATDVAGAKAIIGSVDDVLNSAMIDGASVTIGGGATEIATDVWASLRKNSDGSLTVAWGRNTDDVTAALTAFENAWKNDKLAIGESLVADASGLADNDYSDCFQLDDKKSKGTLA